MSVPRPVRPGRMPDAGPGVKPGASLTTGPRSRLPFPILAPSPPAPSHAPLRRLAPSDPVRRMGRREDAARRRPARRRRRQAAQPRLRDRHPQGLDRRGRRLQGPAGQGRHRRRPPRRHAEPAPGPLLDRRLRDARRQAAGHAHLGAVQGHAPVGVVPRRRRAARRRPASSWSARTPSEVFFRACGLEEEDLRPRRRRSASTLRGKEIFIRLVDKHSGHWGHVNFDDFRFHADKPNVAAAQGRRPPAPDVYKYAGLPPEKAAAAMTVPEGFTVNAVRRRAGRAPADRLLPRRPRPALGRRGRYPSDSVRGPRPRRRRRRGPHPHLRGHRRRRQVRQAHRLHGGAEPRQRPGGRLRRRLGRGRAVPAVRARSRTARTSRPASRKSCSTAGATRTRTRRSTPSSGGRTAGSTAATASSPTRASASRARRTTSRDADQRRRLALPPDAARLSRSSPTAPATRGASTSTSTARRSSRRASSRTPSTSSRAAATSGRRGAHFNPYTYADIQTIADHRH